MQFFQATLGLAALLASFAVAIPAPAAAPEAVVEVSPDDGTIGILGTATIRVFHGDTCTNLAEQVSIVQGGNRCIPYANVRSIDLVNNGCTVKTWSGNNCRGSQYTVKTGCNSVLYASVSISC